MSPSPLIADRASLVQSNMCPYRKLTLGTWFPIKSYLRWVFSDMFRSQPQVFQVWINVVVKMTADSSSVSPSFPPRGNKQNEDLILDPENVWKVRNFHPKNSSEYFSLKFLRIGWLSTCISTKLQLHSVGPLVGKPCDLQCGRPWFLQTTHLSQYASPSPADTWVFNPCFKQTAWLTESKCLYLLILCTKEWKMSAVLLSPG